MVTPLPRNVGFWFVETLVLGQPFKAEARFHGEVAAVSRYFEITPNRS